MTVLKALARDAGRPLARVPRVARDRLGVKVGERVLLRSGDRSIVRAVWRADAAIAGRLNLRLDPQGRAALGVQPGATVEVVRTAQATLVGQIDTDRYDLLIVERQFSNPFQVSPRLMGITGRLVEGARDDADRAKRVFTWIRKHVSYGASRRLRGVGYRGALEVKTDGEGVCGEQAYLFVSMARISGLTANWVHVTRDNSDRGVHHACAAVVLGGRTVLVDPAYQTFDIQHREFRILDDWAAHQMFYAMRRSA